MRIPWVAVGQVEVQTPGPIWPRPAFGMHFLNVCVKPVNVYYRYKWFSVTITVN